jgi:hypothetical protein
MDSSTNSVGEQISAGEGAGTEEFRIDKCTSNLALCEKINNLVL